MKSGTSTTTNKVPFCKTFRKNKIRWSSIYLFSKTGTFHQKVLPFFKKVPFFKNVRFLIFQTVPLVSISKKTFSKRYLFQKCTFYKKVAIGYLFQKITSFEEVRFRTFQGYFRKMNFFQKHTFFINVPFWKMYLLKKGTFFLNFKTVRFSQRGTFFSKKYLFLKKVPFLKKVSFSQKGTFFSKRYLFLKRVPFSKRLKGTF